MSSPTRRHNRAVGVDPCDTNDLPGDDTFSTPPSATFGRCRPRPITGSPSATNPADNRGQPSGMPAPEGGHVQSPVEGLTDSSGATLIEAYQPTLDALRAALAREVDDRR